MANVQTPEEVKVFTEAEADLLAKAYAYVLSPAYGINEEEFEPAPTA